MLYSTDKNMEINRIPHEKEYLIWRKRLTSEEYESIIEEINNRINGKQVETSSWIPGSNWHGTVWEPIYTKACLNDIKSSGLCFGLFVWVTMMKRPEYWSFIRYSKDNIEIKGLTYFQVQP